MFTLENGKLKGFKMKIFIYKWNLERSYSFYSDKNPHGGEELCEQYFKRMKDYFSDHDVQMRQIKDYGSPIYVIDKWLAVSDVDMNDDLKQIKEISDEFYYQSLDAALEATKI